MNKSLARHWKNLERQQMMELAAIIALIGGVSSVWVVFALISMAIGV